MLMVKSLQQFVITYEVPDVMTGDFLRWLAQGDDRATDYEVDQQPLQEAVIYARREDNRAGPDTGQGDPSSNEGSSNAGVEPK